MAPPAARVDDLQPALWPDLGRHREQDLRRKAAPRPAASCRCAPAHPAGAQTLAPRRALGPRCNAICASSSTCTTECARIRRCAPRTAGYTSRPQKPGSGRSGARAAAGSKAGTDCCEAINAGCEELKRALRRRRRDGSGARAGVAEAQGGEKNAGWHVVKTRKCIGTRNAMRQRRSRE